MADTQELINQAAALGEAIAKHPDVQAFMAARAEVEKDPGAQQVLRGYAEHTQRIHQLEAEQKPIEVADKRKMAEFEQQMAANDALKKMMVAQVGYVTLMNQINQAMESSLASLQKPSSES
jgi:cell fate (sporulation/competence/biofilm development) regulator YlbF (YheA/YmcA/DUF963 family)